MVQPVPDGFHTVTPYLVIQGVNKLLDFVSHAFDAKITDSIEMPDGSVKHAEVQIGDSRVMIGEAGDGQDPMPGMLYLYVPDIDVFYAQAMAAGAESIQEPTDHFYGDRSGGVKDSCGNIWYIATHVEDVPPDELRRRAAEATDQGQDQGQDQGRDQGQG